MKIFLKNIFLISVIILSCISCNSINESGVEIEKVVPADEVISFFQKYFPVNSAPVLSECFFSNNGDKEDKCVIINSFDDFKKYFSCATNILPEIDFNSYTLIIGQKLVPLLCDYDVEQKIVIISKTEAKLYLTWNCPERSYSSFNTLSYWGIYPKFYIKKIITNVVKKQV